MKLKAFQEGKGERTSDELYPIELVEHDTVNTRVKIHYIGYSMNAEIFDFTPPKPLIFPTFSLLALEIKRSLQGSRKASPEVRIEMDF